MGYFEKNNTHCDNQWDGCKPCEQAQNNKQATEKFSKYGEGQGYCSS